MSNEVDGCVRGLQEKSQENSRENSREKSRDESRDRNTSACAVRRGVAFFVNIVRHTRQEGLAVGFAYCVRAIRSAFPSWQRDDGELAAERYLKALGYRILARNWRSPRDRRDEADLIALTPDAAECVIVEVKRAAGPWDALERVDSRKKEVLWRLLLDLESASNARASRHALGKGRTLARALTHARSIRVDLIGVRGVGRSATMVRHDTAIFERRRDSKQHSTAHQSHARDPPRGPPPDPPRDQRQ